MEGLQRQDATFPRNWQLILKDSASVLDRVLEENEARKFINLQTKKTVTSHLVPAEQYINKHLAPRIVLTSSKENC